MSEQSYTLEVVAYFAGVVLIALVFFAGVVGLALWHERASIACPDGQVHVTTDTITGCMPWEEVTDE